MPADLVERLYTAPPDGFVAARAAAVAAARAAGDEATARQIGRLRKPTVAAWMVNLLAIRRPDLVAELVDLADALRTAQRELRGPQLRELSAQRRGTVSALVAQARALATGADARLAAGKLPLAEVETTLQAALADLDVAEQVRSGRLVRAASYAGFGEVPRPQLRLVAGGPELSLPAPPSRSARKATGADQPGRSAAAESSAAESSAAERAAEKRAAAERAGLRRTLVRELASARTEQRRAEADLGRATAAERDGAAALADAERAVVEAERRRAGAEQEVSRRKLARKAAERAVSAARRRTGDVEAAVEALDAE
ncbi:hypothetical protein OG792_29755 [Micromonospora sp. NBC_01699]|uniref:hypothetical protein n=1 Tax=Micromonospora sp. NBC_01699 TaxID=2975984 RepID=UPI002E292D31|nr:hypothetical protein [Micromonospora sp. NBC_01699]